MRNIKLELSYDGTSFHGFQIQQNAHTIEAEITNALRIVLHEDIKIIGCGRTDTGVHALHYVVNFETSTNITAEKLVLAINSQLNRAISVFKASDVHEDFHARYDIAEKTYVYRILNSKIRDPFIDNFVYRYGGELDVKKMKQACVYFKGKHDFSSHKSQGTDTKTSVRTMYDIKVTQEGHIIEIEMTANGFLYNMARTIAGTILECGTSKIKPANVPQILLSKNRINAGATLPAKGLFMKHTKYKGE